MPRRHLAVHAITVYNDRAMATESEPADASSHVATSLQTRSDRWRGLAPPLMTILAGLGFTLGVVVMVWGYTADGDSRKFVGKQETIAWIILIGFQVAFWAVASVYLWSDVLKLRRVAARHEWLVIGLGVLSIYAILAVPIFFTKPLDNPLLHAAGKLQGLQVAAGVLVVLPGLLAIWLLALCFARDEFLRGSTGGEGTAPPHEQDRVRAFLRDRTALLRCGSLLGATIGFATLASGALRNALIAYGNESFSSSMVLAYGASFTALLALVYVPSYVTMEAAARRLLDAHAPEELPDSPTYEQTKSVRAAFEEVLQIKVGPADSLRIATAVLAPLVSGVITVLAGVSVS